MRERLREAVPCSLLGTACGTVFQLAAFLIITHGLTTGSAGVFFESVALFIILSDWTVLGADAALVRFVARLRVMGRRREVAKTLLAGLVPVAACSTIAGAVASRRLADRADVLRREVAGRRCCLRASPQPLRPRSVDYDSCSRGHSRLWEHAPVRRRTKHLRPACSASSAY